MPKLSAQVEDHHAKSSGEDADGEQYPQDYGHACSSVGTACRFRPRVTFGFAS